jgi:hypothetical protein
MIAVLYPIVKRNLTFGLTSGRAEYRIQETGENKNPESRIQEPEEKSFAFILDSEFWLLYSAFPAYSFSWRFP